MEIETKKDQRKDMVIFATKDDGDKEVVTQTMVNFISSVNNSETLKDAALEQLKAVAHAAGNSEHIVEEILANMFAERRGNFPETSSSCDVAEFDKLDKADAYVDKRLKYWQNMLANRRLMQKRVEIHTGKTPEQVLFNRATTVDNRDKETVKRIMDYAERVQPSKVAAKQVAVLPELRDPCTCRLTEAVPETWPQAEALGQKTVEISGIPTAVKEEMLGKEAAHTELPHGWKKSWVLDRRLEEKFTDICEVVEFVPDIDNLEVTGINIEKLKVPPTTELLRKEDMHTVTTSTEKLCEEEQLTFNEFWSSPFLASTESYLDPEPPEIALKVNGKDYIVEDEPFMECVELLIRFTCDPYQRRAKRVLQLKNIGKQTLSFRWSQGVYYYNRGSLLLAGDNEFLFDVNSFRLGRNESYTVTVLYQPRKVRMAVELWRLHVEPCIFCGSHGAIQLRFHGRCTPPKQYLTKLRELHCTAICGANQIEMGSLTGHLAELVPLIEPPPACCPYERPLDEREQFNSLNPGYNCVRFDDLEVLKSMHKALKKPRERSWDLRLDSIKEVIMRNKSTASRDKQFQKLMAVVEPLAGIALSLEVVSKIDEQKQRTRYIYVRGVICNGIEEWEDLVFTIEESFYRSELHHYYMNQFEMEEASEEDEVLTATIEAKGPTKAQLPEDLPIDINSILDKEASAVVMRNLRHSKFFRDSLYIHTYSHLCNIAENIVSVIDSTDIVPT